MRLRFRMITFWDSLLVLAHEHHVKWGLFDQYKPYPRKNAFYFKASLNQNFVSFKERIMVVQSSKLAL